MPILFTQTGCDESRKVRNWLTEHGVAFIERNVSVDPDAVNELLATGLFGTPLLIVGDEQIIGLRPDKLAAALSRSR